MPFDAGGCDTSSWLYHSCTIVRHFDGFVGNSVPCSYAPTTKSISLGPFEGGPSGYERLGALAGVLLGLALCLGSVFCLLFSVAMQKEMDEAAEAERKRAELIENLNPVKRISSLFSWGKKNELV